MIINQNKYLSFNEQLNLLNETENILDYKFNVIINENKNYITESFIGTLFNSIKAFINKIIQFIIKLWKSFINILKKIINKIKSLFTKSNSGIKNPVKIDKNAMFAFSTRGREINFKSYSSLYNAYKESLSSITSETSNISKASVRYLDILKKEQERLNKSLNNIVTEKVQYYDTVFHYFEDDMKSGYESDEDFQNTFKEPFMLQAGYMFDQLFLENAATLNIDDLKEITDSEKDYLKTYDILKNSTPEYFYNFISSHRNVFMNYNMRFKTRNNMLFNFLDGLKIYEKDEFINFFKSNVIPYFPNTDEGRKQLKDHINLIVKQNNAIKECLENLIKLDFLEFSINTKDELFSSSKNQGIERATTLFNDLIRNNVQSFKKIHNDTIIYDFKKLNYGMIMVSSENEKMIDKLFAAEYSTTLFYYITNFDITIMTHGYSKNYSLADYYNNFINPSEKMIFDKIYGKVISKYEQIMGKPITECSSENDDLIFVQKRFINKSFNEFTNIVAKNGLNFSKIEERRCVGINRWIADEKDGLTPIDSSYSFHDIELLLYYLSERYKKINVNICNPGGFIPTYKLIEDPKFTIYMPTRSIVTG